MKCSTHTLTQEIPMNPKAKMMSVPGYVKKSRKNVRHIEKAAWKKDQGLR